MNSPDFFEGALSNIILNRNLEHLRRALELRSWSVEAFGSLPINALDLAIGWADGLKVLATVWTGSIAAAIELAAQMREYGSLEILCNEFNVPLFGDESELCQYTRTMLAYYRSYFILAGALRQRREALANIAHRYLSQDDLSSLGIEDERTLDAKARPVYDLLKERSVPLEPRLFPGPPGSMYGSIARTYRDYSDKLYLTVMPSLYQLYESNFLDIDNRDALRQMRTPLDEFLLSRSENDDDWVIVCMWLLKRGASPTFGKDEPYDNLLVRVAKSIACLSEDLFRDRSGRPAMKNLVQYASGLCSPTQADECLCFCSANGCLALHHLLRQDMFTLNGWCHGHREDRTLFWAEQCHFEPDDAEYAACLEAFVRLELFNRLGMAHTCCSWGLSTRNEAENERIREEDAELNAQLNLLMEVYRHTRSRWPEPEADSEYVSRVECGCVHEGADSWLFYVRGTLMAHNTWWWYKVRQILPDLWSHKRPWQPPGDEMEIFVQGTLLKRQGYDGLDFSEVIRRHFRDDLPVSPAQTETEGSASTSITHDRDSAVSQGGVGAESDGAGTAASESNKEFVPRERPELLQQVLEFFDYEYGTPEDFSCWDTDVEEAFAALDESGRLDELSTTDHTGLENRVIIEEVSD